MKKYIIIPLLILIFSASLSAQKQFKRDTIATSAGNLEVTFVGHGSLMFSFGGKIIHVDPWGKSSDYSKMPKADMVLITHDHRDHLDADALAEIRTDQTQLILTETCAVKLGSGTVMKNGDVKTIDGLTIEAVPAYNLVHKRKNGKPFHPKGSGNGYVILFGDKRVYGAGDTENIPEMKNLKRIDVAFLPMNLPYTMTPEMVADAAKAFKPKVLYPYHYGKTDTSKLVQLLKDSKEIEVRIR